MKNLKSIYKGLTETIYFYLNPNMFLKMGFLIILTMGLGACGKKDNNNSASVVPARDSRTSGGVAGRTVNGSSTIPGTVTTGSGTIQTSQYLVDQFVSSMGKPEDVVGLIGAAGTGVKFNAISGGGLEIIITDSYALNKQADPIVMNQFILEDQQFQSGYAALTYHDSYGRIQLVGAYNNTTFSGTIYFANDSFGDTGEMPGASGVLGTFSIPVQSIFNFSNSYNYSF